MYPTLDYLKSIPEKYNYLPVMERFNADLYTPISIFKSIKPEYYSFLLESVEGEEKVARYSFMGVNPELRFEAFGKDIYITDSENNKTNQNGNPLDFLAVLLKKYESPKIPNMPRFCGGAIGYTAYDAVRFIEKLPKVPKDELGLPDIHYMFYREVIVYDHVRQQIDIIVNMDGHKDIEEEYKKARVRIHEIFRQITESKITQETSINKEADKFKLMAYTSEEEYKRAVSIAKEHIVKGDIFQVVPSQRFCTENRQDPFDVYRNLRIINPSSYMFYINFKDYCLAGASPEMLLRVENGVVETCPIAGTRKRDQDPAVDEKLAKELLNDEKETAEHVMLVDLGRNDIGKVSEFGSVRVARFKEIQRYSHVMHLVSNVKGKLRSDLGCIDAFKAVFPAGTLSGAPKVMAMKIIDELEKVKRGPYGGAVGYIGYDGNMDLCITIRTIVFKGNMAYLQSGGGVVYDSDPKKEYEECINKAMALFKALEGGIPV